MSPSDPVTHFGTILRPLKWCPSVLRGQQGLSLRHCCALGLAGMVALLSLQSIKTGFCTMYSIISISNLHGHTWWAENLRLGSGRGICHMILLCTVDITVYSPLFGPNYLTSRGYVMHQVTRYVMV